MELKKMFTNQIDKLTQLADELRFEDKEFLFHWYSQQYHLVRNSSRYLAFAASKVSLSSAKEFKNWAHHLTEEIDHDLLILKDIQNLGFKEVASILPETRALVAAQYYDIDVNGPNALLGYALLLEGLSCAKCKDLSVRIEKAHSVKSLYLNLHAEVDQEHYPEGIEQVMTLSESEKKIVADNLLMAASLYQSIITKLVEVHLEKVNQNGNNKLNIINIKAA